MFVLGCSVGATVFAYCTFSRREPRASYIGEARRCDALAVLVQTVDFRRTRVGSEFSAIQRMVSILWPSHFRLARMPAWPGEEMESGD